MMHFQNDSLPATPCVRVAACCLTALSALLSSSLDLHAQQTRVLPEQRLANTPGRGYAPVFSFFYGRGMQLYDKAQLGFSRATITEIAFRRASVDANRTYATRTRNTRVRIGYSDASPNLMPRRFSQVPNGPMTTVFSGPLTLPTAPPPASGSAAPFTVRIPLSTPFPFDAANGNLVIDVESSVTIVTGDALYSLDAVGYTNDYADVGGQLRYEAGCGVPNIAGTTAVGYTTGPGAFMLGNRFDIDLLQRDPRNFGDPVLSIGRFRTSPLDLTGFGAPGCRSWVDPFVFVPVSMVPCGTFRCGVVAGIETPVDPAFAGARIGLQAVMPSPATALGVVPGDAAELRMGAPSPNPWRVQLLYNQNIQADYGDLFGPFSAGIVTQLSGTFQ